MDLIEFKTKSGYTVFLKPVLTFGDYEVIKSEMRKAFAFDVNPSADLSNLKKEDVKMRQLDFDSLTAGKKVAKSLLVKKVLDPLGKEFPGGWYDLPIEDGEEVESKVQEIYDQSETLSKKKGIN